MPPATNFLGVILALASAVVWGSGDFTGGLATRRNNQYQVLALSAFSGLVVLIVAAVVWREGLPSLASTFWAMLAGISGAVGIAALYRALSLGHAASTAPTAAVIGAALPVLYGVITAGIPTPTKLLGFGLAFVGIWLVSADSAGTERVTPQEFRLACLAGAGFGGFFLFVGLVDPGKIFTPLIISRSFALATGIALIQFNHITFPSLKTNPPALLAGILDAGGNLFYILAKQFTRLETAAVLAAFYPASTVILASVILKEKVSNRQRVGLLFCLAAIALISV